MKNVWEESGGFLKKTLRFKNFKEVLHFVNKVGGIAEGMGHHPDIYIENYNQATIKTTTHDAGNSITDKDYNLARAIDAIK